MEISIQLCSILVALIWLGSLEVNGAKFLAEKPAFLDICKRSDSEFGKCWAKNLEKMFNGWKSGVPGLKSIGSLDPLHVKRAKITQGAEGSPISMNMELVNAELSGLGGTIIDDAGSNGNSLEMKLRVTVPSFKLTGDYTMHGNILSLALNSKGKALMIFEKATFTLNFRLKLREDGAQSFADVEKLDLLWEDNGGMQFHLSNLFNGDKALEDSAHALLNANWRAIFEVLRPALSQTNKIVVKDILSVPGLKTLGSLDPLHIKRAKFSQGGKNDIISIDMDLANVELMGLSDVIIEDIGSNGNNLDIKFKLTAPNFKWNGDYAMKGNILSLALDSKGKTFMAFEKPTFTLNYKMKLRKEGDYEFADLEKLHLVWEDNANVQFRLENLFNGDKALEDSAHTLLNANWRPIFENLRPVLSQTNEIVLKDILNKIMAYVPTFGFFLKKKMKYCICLTLLFWTTSAVVGKKVLTEKPAFLNACPIEATDVGSCFAKNLEAMFHEWKAGVPGLKSIGSLDPLHVKRISIEQAVSGPISLNLNMQNAEIFGLSGTSITDVGTDAKKLTFKFNINVPEFKLISDYAVNGNLLSLALNSKGKAEIMMEKALLNLAIRVKIRENGDFKFGQLEKLHLVWEDVGGMHLHLDNIFNGDATLEDSAHALINENWRSIFEVLRPALTQTVEVIMKDFLGKILSHIPVTYLLDGL
ncbi:uncharacterized protein LOC101897216 [Musca domestica]|uniref:Uncharacterized protein LOC101897216 n=1 Tax=Musca domestica TaxID=7370 RepID=A0ABM3V7X5_MUSDO|nr:uncharacterized protein LOC101897216 [Musca domestica]